ncbi:hypothetical protein NECAME_15384 [Necator americanus]|uniref:ShKT domain-containing protein n=1 Tax=Necator americanus TaxID=51031 RepID=W2SI64_NECAM|nr:hypothetical protein NECAME_15384 [Necator americanus]ETN69339.1 hypothetical protein NECAME_15384 [Necator americanus]
MSVKEIFASEKFRIGLLFFCFHLCFVSLPALDENKDFSAAPCGSDPNCVNWVRNGFCNSIAYTQEQKRQYCGTNRKESLDCGGKPGAVAPRKTGLQESYRLPKRKRTRMTICTYSTHTLASEAPIKDLMTQAKKIKCDFIALIENWRRHTLNAVYETGEELFLGTCDSRGVGGAGILLNTSMTKNIDSFEQFTTLIGRLRMRRCGPAPAGACVTCML